MMNMLWSDGLLFSAAVNADVVVHSNICRLSYL